MIISKYKFNEQVRIYNLGDIHRGNPGCNEKFFRFAIEEIRKDQNAYWLSTGDLLEVATKHSVGDSHAAMSTQEELDVLTEEIEPIKNKCLGVVASNHHRRVARETGLNMDKAVAFQAGLPYLGIHAILNIGVGHGRYYLCLHHGTGGGTVGNSINRAIKGSSIYKGADVYFSGHTHKMSIIPFSQKIIDRKNNIVRAIQSYSIITGHCLEWEESYAEEKQLDPALMGFAYVDLYPNLCGREEGKKIVCGFLT